MLYVIAAHLGFPGALNLIRYISFRAGAASGTCSKSTAAKCC